MQNTSDQSSSSASSTASPLNPNSTDGVPNSQLPKSNKRSLLLIVSAIGLVLIIAGVLVYAFVIHNKTTGSTTNASSTSSRMTPKSAVRALSSNVADIGSAISSNSGPSTVSRIEVQDKAIQKKLTDAESQYVFLANSVTIKANGVANQAMQALVIKWAPFDNFVKETTYDNGVIFPPLLNYLSDIDSLYRSAPPSTSPQYSAYLAQVEQDNSSAITSFNTVKPKLALDQQGVSDISSYLNAVSQDLSSEQNDLKTGNQAGVQSVMTDIETRTATFENAISSVNNLLNNQEKSLNPGTQISNLQSAINKL